MRMRAIMLVVGVGLLCGCATKPSACVETRNGSEVIEDNHLRWQSEQIRMQEEENDRVFRDDYYLP